jgi:REP element-mobilizing transposase RayT
MVEPKGSPTTVIFSDNKYPFFPMSLRQDVRHAVRMITRAQSRGHAALRLGRHSMPGEVYFITVVCTKREHLLEYKAAMAAAKALWQLHSSGQASVLAWVVMPDHLHTLIKLNATCSLANTVARMHSCVAIAANRAQGRVGRFWQGAYYDRLIRDDAQLKNTVHYLIQNPIEAGLSDHCGNYPFWNITDSALWPNNL